jgi:O-acetyl-ADP-ribose deacetylase (regulator of RNase III)
MQKIEKIYKNVKIVIVKGDITTFNVDAIVNPANSLMVMGGGVAGAIKRVGGKEIEEEAMKHAPVDIGKTIVTKAGKLKAKYVIHTPTMQKPAMPTDKINVQKATKAALECAEKLKIKTIAFPGLGTGVGGLDINTAATTMINEIKSYIEKNPTIEKIILVGFTDEIMTSFKNAVEQTIK